MTDRNAVGFCFFEGSAGSCAVDAIVLEWQPRDLGSRQLKSGIEAR